MKAGLAKSAEGHTPAPPYSGESGSRGARRLGFSERYACGPAPLCSPLPGAPGRGSRSAGGFTLLELIVVMLLMCVAAAIAVPSMRGFGENQRIRGCTAQIVALAQWARAQAITHGVPHRLNLDPATRTYWLTIERAGVFETVGQDFGRTFTAPEGITIRWYGAVGTSGSMYPYVEFLPTGRTSGAASILLTDAAGHVTEIACLSAAEPFRVLSDAERVMR